MLDKMIARILDWLIAIVVVCFLIWFFITQPLFTVTSSDNLPEVSETNLRNHVTNLQNIESTKQVSKDTALGTDDYIFNYFSRLGKPSLQSFNTVTGRYNNVRLRLGPNTKERMVIGVRYVAVPNATARLTNASGLAVMLETARLFSRYANELPISVEFVAFGDSNSDIAGEGSFHHAKALSDAKIPVSLMLELQSVGYYRKVAGSQTYPFSFMKVLYPDTGNFIALSSRLVDFAELRSVKHSFSGIKDLPVESFTTPESVSLADGVDHVNYWLNNYPAIQVGDLLPLRVEAGDNELVMNYPRMSQVVKALYQTAIQQSASEDDQEGYLDRLISSASKLL